MDTAEAPRQSSSAVDKEAFQPLDLIPAPLTLLLGSIPFFIFLCILLVIPILQVAIGGAYRNQCSINSNIPVYLIVSGSCGIAAILLILAIVAGFIFIIKRNTIAATFVIGCLMISILLFIMLLSFFLFAWFIVGSVWVFSAKKDVQHDNPLLTNYCQRTLYEFAFAILIINYVMMFFCCCVRCIRGVFQRGKAEE